MVGSRLYVGGLPYGVRESDLERFFKGYGRTRDILIKNGYGFVEFEDYRDADDAVYELNGKKLLGERVVVEPSRGTARGSGGHRDRYDRYDNDRRGGGDRYNVKNKNNRSNSRYGPAYSTEYRLIVENLSSRVTWRDLKDYMRQAGEVTYADAHKQRSNEGVVEFASLSDMKRAIEKLDDTDLNGCRIRLVEDRRGGSGLSSSRSRRRSRSRSRRSSRSRSKSHSRSKSRIESKSPVKSRSRSRSISKLREISKSKSKSRSRSGSRSIKRASRSRPRSRSNSKRFRSVLRSRTKSRGARTESKSPVKSRSRSISKIREISKPKSKSRSRSGSLQIKRDSRSRPRSRSNSKRQAHSRSRSMSRRHSRSRDRSASVDNKSHSKSRSASPKNVNASPDRNNENMDD